MSASKLEKGLDNAHSLLLEELLVHLQADRKNGISSSEIETRRARHGLNQLQEAPSEPWWKKLLAQFNNMMIWILIIAGVIAGVMGEWTDTGAIMAIVILNGIMGYLQEEKAEKALAALKKLSAPMAKVRRNGRLASIPAIELLPGDVVELEGGDHVPADARLLEAFSLRVQEAAFTGESVPVDKDVQATCSKETPLADRKNMLYMGTVAVGGKGTAVVTSIGMSTELGHIAEMLQSQEREPTPLQRRLEELGRVLIVICLVLVAIVFGLQMMQGGKPAEVFLLSISLAVAAVPEGLPAVVTIALALGLQRMVKRNALIRKLPSVETLGCVTVICSDKTGTLTRNEMTVREIIAGGYRYRITGAGYMPKGDFFREEGKRPAAAHSPGDKQDWGSPVDPRGEGDLQRLFLIASRCNHAQLTLKENERDRWEILGDPTEGAVLVATLKGGASEAQRDEPIVHELPFDSERKAMSVVIRDEEEKLLMLTKGAPEVILNACIAELHAGKIVPLGDERRRELADLNAEMASRALRVLALGYREMSENNHLDYREEQLVFVGLMGMIDPPRDEVKVAVQSCREAGIRPVMITGDHPATARAIAMELGIADANDRVMTGAELNAAGDGDLAANVQNVAVYARVSAEHKLRVVSAWKNRGDVVAMTGDGVNDAPAVRAADIGIAMGITGTDVTKEASDMVLTDDNFASIVNAVEEGRGIYENIQKFMHFLLSCNAGEVMFMMFASVMDWIPLTPIQLLWINLVTDGLPALALSMEPPEPDIMQRSPRSAKESVITWKRGAVIMMHGALIAAAAAVGFWLVYRGKNSTDGELKQAQCVAFCIMAFGQLCYSFGCRSLKHIMPEVGLFTNPTLIGAIAISALLQWTVVVVPWFQGIFKTDVSIGNHWEIIILLSLTPVTIVEVAKLVGAFFRRIGG